MPTYTIALATRSADRPTLSDSEAADMATLGFRFAEFTPEASRYRLSIPYRTLHTSERRGAAEGSGACAPRRGRSGTRRAVR